MNPFEQIQKQLGALNTGQNELSILHSILALGAALDIATPGANPGKEALATLKEIIGDHYVTHIVAKHLSSHYTL
jgi:hypothetical protein